MTTAPDLGTRHLFPSFARCRGTRDRWSIVADPAVLEHGEQVTQSGSIARSVGALPYTIGIIVGAAIATITALLANSRATAGWAIIGLIFGGAAVFAVVFVKEEIRHKKAAGNVLRIEPDEVEMWSFCELVERLAATEAWKSGLIDHDRVLPRLLWRVIKSYRDSAPLEDDLQRARNHSGLADIVAQKEKQLLEVRGEIQAVREHLEVMVQHAQRLDDREDARRLQAAERNEEAALRERLGAAIPPSPAEIVQAADHAERARSTAAALQELLDESDRLSAELARFRRH